MFNPSLPADNSPLRSDEMRGQLTALKALIDALLAGLTDGALPLKSGSALTDSAITQDINNVIVAGGKLLSLRRSDTPDAVLLEVHNGTEVVFHLRITADGAKICFASNRPGFSFQTPLDVNGAPLAMKPVSVGPYSGMFSDPPTQGEMQAFAAWVETLRAAL